MKKALEPYIRNTGIFTQPGTQEPYRANLMLSEQLQENFQNAAGIVIFYEAKPAADGTRGVLFLDGHVGRIKETDWPRLKKISKIP
ncbi:MAG: hypothetical protein JOZ57_15285 [Abitibacteriaceae bacterium]|nr:hypothetical protein [Abditibacteriaceae bacterium]